MLPSLTNFLCPTINVIMRGTSSTWLPSRNSAHYDCVACVRTYGAA